MSFTYQYNGILWSLAVLLVFLGLRLHAMQPLHVYQDSPLYDMAKARHDGVDGKEQTSKDFQSSLANSQLVFPDI